MPEATNSIRAQWRVPGDAGAAFELLARPEDWPRWWASVHARARVLDAASAGGRGPAVLLVSHGRTPTYSMISRKSASASRRVMSRPPILRWT